MNPIHRSPCGCEFHSPVVTGSPPAGSRSSTGSTDCESQHDVTRSLRISIVPCLSADLGATPTSIASNLRYESRDVLRCHCRRNKIMSRIVTPTWPCHLAAYGKLWLEALLLMSSSSSLQKTLQEGRETTVRVSIPGSHGNSGKIPLPTTVRNAKRKKVLAS